MDLAIAQSMIKNNYSVPQYPMQFYSQQSRTSILRSKGSSQQLLQDAQVEEYLNENVDDDIQKKNRVIVNLLRSANEKLNSVINNETIRKPYPVVVRVFLIFLKIGEIDNIKERFQADAYIEASWEDDRINLNANGEFDPHNNWEPEIFIDNAIGSLKQEVRYKFEKKGNKTTVCEMRSIKGLFWERLELWDFPLDIQELSITITSAKSSDEVQFEPSLENDCTINTSDFRQQQEWNLYEHVETSKKFRNDLWKNYDRPCYSVTSTVSRRPGYFLYNAYMLIFFISTLGFAPFSFACTSPHFRIQTTCLLILSSVNFRWIVTQRLPTVSYLTTLDKYAIVALVFLVLLCVWHAIIGSSLFNSFDGGTRINIDIYVLIGIAAFYVLFHLAYMTYFFIKFRRYKYIGQDTDGEKKKDDDLDLKNAESPVSNAEHGQSPSSVSSQQLLVRSTNQTKVTNRNPNSSEKNNQLQNPNHNGDVKYRSLMESPSSSASSDMPAKPNNSMKYKAMPNQGQHMSPIAQSPMVMNPGSGPGPSFQNNYHSTAPNPTAMKQYRQ